MAHYVNECSLVVEKKIRKWWGKLSLHMKYRKTNSKPLAVSVIFVFYVTF